VVIHQEQKYALKEKCGVIAYIGVAPQTVYGKTRVGQISSEEAHPASVLARLAASQGAVSTPVATLLA
jgi:hypothetical protein